MCSSSCLSQSYFKCSTNTISEFRILYITWGCLRSHFFCKSWKKQKQVKFYTLGYYLERLFFINRFLMMGIGSIPEPPAVTLDLFRKTKSSRGFTICLYEKRSCQPSLLHRAKQTFCFAHQLHIFLAICRSSNKTSQFANLADGRWDEPNDMIEATLEEYCLRGFLVELISGFWLISHKST
jgi:hypothetical protein